MDILLIKLFIAHLLGDFFFQFDSWVKEKETKKLKSPKFYLHIFIHGVLILLLVWNANFFLEALVLTFLHAIIDAIKLFFQKENTRRLWFFTDQLLHLISIIAVWYSVTNVRLNNDFLNNTNFWICVAAILILTFPASILIKVLIAKWTPTHNIQNATNAETSLQSAGKYIGIMERLLIFIFIYTNHFEAVGFLLGAKSIFRFGDLKEGNELKLTEYVLIGTFLSFGIAIALSLTLKASII
jgi:signal transduction histidine kinase